MEDLNVLYRSVLQGEVTARPELIGEALLARGRQLLAAADSLCEADRGLLYVELITGMTLVDSDSFDTLLPSRMRNELMTLTGQLIELEEVDLDLISREYTAFTTFEELVNAQGAYRPSLPVKSGVGPSPLIRIRDQRLLGILADAYDSRMAEAGRDRAAFRW